MIDLDNKLIDEYVAECHEHLDAIGKGLLAIEKDGAEVNEALVNRVFRATHSIAGGAIIFQLDKIGELARQIEDTLALVRSGRMAPTPNRIGVLLRAADRLQVLLENPDAS